MTMIKDITETLKEKGLRSTSQRMLILDILEAEGHCDIETLYETVLRTIPSVSLATVYKNIHSLLDAGIISEVRVKDKKLLYEINRASHVHFVCSNCGEIEDLQMDYNTIFSLIKQLSGKDVHEQSIVLYGTCQKCSN